MIFDLHAHTNFSDGSLTPGELISRAIERSVDVLAITDHDTVDAFRVSPATGDKIKLIPGIEFSTQWGNSGIHVLGLNIDPGSDAMEAGVRIQSDARLERARRIAEKLEKRGVENAFEGASGFSSGDYIGRPHFARYLVSIGKSRDIQDAFKKYMGDGKVGDVRQHWADLPQVVEWIRAAGGIAVLAHPLKYKMTRTRLKLLLNRFIEVGGEGMEVVSGQQTRQQTTSIARLCGEMGLLASCGSDFHRPDSQWAELGGFAALPENLEPVWERF